MRKPESMTGFQPHVSPLPRRRNEATCGLSEHFDEIALSANERVPRFFGIEAIHLVAAVGEQGRCAPASLTLMEVAVKQQLLGAFLNQPAIIRMLRQRPSPVPVGDDSERQATPDKRCKVLDHDAGLVRVSRGRVMNADEETTFRTGRSMRHEIEPLTLIPQSLSVRYCRLPPYMPVGIVSVTSFSACTPFG